MQDTALLKGSKALQQPFTSARSSFNGRRIVLADPASAHRRSYRLNFKCKAVAEISAEQEAIERRGEASCCMLLPGLGSSGKLLVCRRAWRPGPADQQLRRHRIRCCPTLLGAAC